MECIDGFMQSRYMLPSGECSRCIGLADAIMVITNAITVM